MDELTITLFDRVDDLVANPAVRDSIESGRTLGFDIETHYDPSDTNHPLTNTVVSLQIVDLETRNGYFIVAAGCPVTTPLLKDWLEDPYRRKVIHYASFETTRLLAEGVVVRGAVDTCIALKALVNGIKWDDPDRKRAHAGFSLRDGVFYLTDGEVDLSDGKDEFQCSFRATQTQFSDGQIAYGIADAYWALKLAERIWPELDGLAPSVAVDQALVPYIEQMAARGVPVDLEMWETMMDDAQRELDETAMAFASLPLNENMFGTVGDVKMSAPAQVREVLSKLGVDLPDFQKETVARATAELEAITSRSDTQQVALEALTLYTRWKRAEKLLQWRDAPDGDGRMRWTAGRTETGRLTSRNVNVLGLPAAARWAILAGEGRVIVARDYANIEDRIAAKLSGDLVKQADLRTGRDVFSAIAAELQDELDQLADVDPEAAKVTVTRGMVKTAYYASLYGGGARRIAAALGTPLAVAKGLLAKLEETYPVLFAFMKANKLEQVTPTGYLSSLAKVSSARWFRVSTGRRLRWFKEPVKDNGQRDNQRWAAILREASNFPIQSTGADIALRALGKICRTIEEHPEWEAEMILFVHDEFVVECAEPCAAEVQQAVDEAMTAAFEQFIDESVPCVIGGGIDRCYGNIK